VKNGYPLAFIASVYGMNFREPEVTSPRGYPGFWLASVVIVVAMLLYFRRKQWILQSTARNVKEK
jgi:magnesium transporter